ncbi:Serine/threonine protein kinase [Phytophthora megakarya]|uniref:Serine/threonine protein kinase n=1 Tax=Phytophthora megakarya TaxID=4795 RepID=A0A225VEE4_9STRA|nr:Serine/threonine protein kinase [Phytophthora megakarya]
MVTLCVNQLFGMDSTTLTSLGCTEGVMLETQFSLSANMSKSAAIGLRFLLESKVVHGDLKCNNILVDGDTAKICDFGFSYVRERSDSLQAQTKQIRWKAPEAIMPLDQNLNPRFASDVFSFGMCIIEAFLEGEPPYGLDDDDTIIGKILDGEKYPRPDGIQDDEWAFVLRLCEYDWEARLTIDDALRTLKMFADREVAGSQPLECFKCKITLPSEAVACWKCASLMKDN